MLCWCRRVPRGWLPPPERFGDILATAIYVTEDRKQIADFVPVSSSKHDVIVSGPSAPTLASLGDLSGS